ncbi:MAG TPA: gliding motility protein GldN [Lacibacter sp.]|nr:gliding motility protein GldN [Lacibacter sp.]HMO88711.1 gliding motility protein GldN [Lacibacter sp.]HMP86771.1 gliding motility protein GldN [Lacibacter sp.]
MKMKNLGPALLLLLLVAELDVNAQQRPRTRTQRPAQQQQAPASGYGTQPSGYGTQPSGYGNNNQQQQTNIPKSNIPIRVVPSTGNAIMDTVKPSLRNDASIERNLIKDRKPLAYEHIREDDAVYRQRVWRELDTREKMNLPFRYAADEDNGNQRFIAILMKAIRNREITAFDATADDRFTTPMTPDAVMKAFSGGLDTVPVYDFNGDITEYKVTNKEVDPDSIYRFRIKEEWVFDKESSRMFVRILGIAPLKRLTRSDGTDIIPGQPEYAPMFWVYYPDCRELLSKYEAFNGKNFGARMTWEELFENRMFSSYIVKSTLDNPYDRTLRAYIKDPILRLLEGENIKEKIFNYEQDLWSY